jgi:CBS domain-containing protein
MHAGVDWVAPDTRLSEVARIMREKDVGAIPVGENDRLVGMITDRDIAVRGVAKGHGPETRVRDLMTGDLVIVRVDDDVEDAAAKMSEAQVRRLPVIDEDDRLCGIVSLGDLARETDSESAHEALAASSSMWA